MNDTTLAVTPAAPAAAAAPPLPPGFAAEEPALFAPLYPLPRLELVAGKGARVTDAAGREYLDFVSGIAVNAFGHAPEGLADVLAQQARALVHASNLYTHPNGLALARELTQATGYDRAFFCNSGTEGMDAALKFARARAGVLGKKGRDIVAFTGGFHGRTGFALSATHTPAYRAPFEPLIPGIRFAPFNDLAALTDALTQDVCAIVVEPVQGESGAVPATPEFLHALRTRATALGAALVFDEVQTGMGRTGTLLAQEQFGVKADLTVLSKALGAGVPIGAVLMTAEVAACLSPGMHGCTFGGNPLATAAARWSLAQVTAPGVLARVREASARLADGLAALAARHPSVREVRGLGLLRAVDLSADAGFGPADLAAAAREQGLLLVRGGERALRLLPPLTVTNEELSEALARLDAALTVLETRAAHKGDTQ
ncbi:MAG: aspartate aminotransferase family protein [Candidatus Eisenbacteria bacterium]